MRTPPVITSIEEILFLKLESKFNTHRYTPAYINHLARYKADINNSDGFKFIEPTIKDTVAEIEKISKGLMSLGLVNFPLSKDTKTNKATAISAAVIAIPFEN